MICCCSLAGTKACFTCSNNMSGTHDRYPPPYMCYTPETVSQTIAIPTTYEELAQKALENLKNLSARLEEAHKAAGESTLHFGSSSDEEDAQLELVFPI